MRWLKKLQDISRRPRRTIVFTLDRDGGLVVSRSALVRSKLMDRQLKAAELLHEKDQQELIVAQTNE